MDPCCPEGERLRAAVDDADADIADRADAYAAYLVHRCTHGGKQ